MCRAGWADTTAAELNRHSPLRDGVILPNANKLYLGIDLLIARGPTLEVVVCAIAEVAGIQRAAVNIAGQNPEHLLAIADHPAWAVVHSYAGSDFAFKVDLDGVAPRDYHAIGRQLARTLNVAVAWADERTLSPLAFMLCLPDAAEYPVMLYDCAPDGFMLTTNDV